MIHIFKSHDANVYPSALAENNRTQDRIFIAANTRLPRIPCVLFRQLLGHFKPLRVAEALSSQPTALGWITGTILPDDDSLGAQNLVDDVRWLATLDSHLTHNLPFMSTFVKRCAAIIRELIGTHRTVIIINDALALDKPSMRLLRELVVDSCETHISWLIGIPEVPYAARWCDVDTGIEWGQSLLKTKSELTSLSSSAHIQLWGKDEFDNWSLFPSPQYSELDTALEETARHLVSSNNMDHWSKSQEALLWKAAAKSFRCFSFTSALYLADRLLRKASGSLPATAYGAAHSICALSAHNRQFFADGNNALADYICHHLKEALSVERCGAVLAAIRYRLAVTEARRRRNANQAEIHVNAGLLLLDRSQLSAVRDRLLRSWLYNILGYIEVIRKDPVACEHAMSNAYILLEDKCFVGTSYEEEAEYSKAVICENTALLMRYTGRPRDWALWWDKGSTHIGSWPELHTADAAERVALALYTLDLTSALSNARYGYDAATRNSSYAQRHYFASLEGHICLRLGQFTAAEEAFLKALRILSEAELAFTDAAHHLINCGMAMYYDQQPARAAAYIRRASQLVSVDSVTDQLQIKGRLAQTLAAIGREEGLETLANEMVELLQNEPSPNNILTVNLRLSYACMSVGDTTNAETMGVEALRVLRQLAPEMHDSRRAIAVPLEALALIFELETLDHYMRFDDWQLLVRLIEARLQDSTEAWLSLTWLFKGLRRRVDILRELDISTLHPLIDAGLTNGQSMGDAKCAREYLRRLGRVQRN